MSRRPYPAILLFAMSVPGAAWPLGLGEIRVNSALNEPLTAQIAIVGANAADLAMITAKVADADAFQRLGADRPSYLSTVQFSVGRDSNGQPVLKVRSAAPFADPVVSLLVDLHWSSGELIREFSLLLDPAAFAPSVSTTSVESTPSDESAPSDESTIPVESATTAAPVALIELPSRAELAALLQPDTASASPVRPVRVAAAAVPQLRRVIDSLPVASPYRVVAGDTLWRIVRRAGAHSEADAQRMMAEVFRANPEAFDGDINRLHADALLTLPSVDERRVLSSRRRFTAGDRAAMVHLDAPSVQVLTNRVLSLETSLQAVRWQLDVAGAAIKSLQRSAEVSPPVPDVVAAVPAAASPRTGLAGSLAGGLGILLAGIVFLARRRAAPAHAPQVVPPSAPTDETLADTRKLPQASDHSAQDPMNEDTVLLGESDLNETGATARMEGNPEPDAATHVGSSADTVTMEGIESDASIMDILARGTDVKLVQSTVLDYNLVDLDSGAQHVHLPSDLNDRPVMSERRVSVVDALQSAITRDPHRHDLRMKLLETYYATALANQRAFVDFAGLQAREPGNLSARDWEKILAMGREIAPLDDMFDDKEDGDLSSLPARRSA